MLRIKNNKGQSILSEHVMIFFVAVAAVTVMTTYVQRSLEARIHDVRNFVVNSANSACDANCQEATGNKISYEYEPYYTKMSTTARHNSSETHGITPGKPRVIGSIYSKSNNEQTNSVSTSNLLPAECADAANRPAYCADL